MASYLKLKKVGERKTSNVIIFYMVVTVNDFIIRFYSCIRDLFGAKIYIKKKRTYFSSNSVHFSVSIKAYIGKQGLSFSKLKR